MNILVLGASGLIGSAMYRVLSSYETFNVWGTMRNRNYINMFDNRQCINIRFVDDLLATNSIVKLLMEIKPKVVINCVGLTKHQKGTDDPQISLPINALFPHKLSDLCLLYGSKVIHISTDCIFLGDSGPYSENDTPDACDIYGKSKILGELNNLNSLTIRTSTIGHEYMSSYGLLDWFLSQNNWCHGYANARFSGLTNTEFAKVIADYVIPNEKMSGIYHVGGPEISKYELLKIFSSAYNKKIEIKKDENFIINRSLISKKFNDFTGYKPTSWEEMVLSMRNHKLINGY